MTTGRGGVGCDDAVASPAAGGVTDNASVGPTPDSHPIDNRPGRHPWQMSSRSPPAANASPAIEMIRVWLANGQLYTVLNIGFWEDRRLDERSAWCVLLADVVRFADACSSIPYAESDSRCG